MASDRLYDQLTKHDLEELKELGLKEHEHFFKRNPPDPDDPDKVIMRYLLARNARTKRRGETS